MAMNINTKDSYNDIISFLFNKNLDISIIEESFNYVINKNCID